MGYFPNGTAGDDYAMRYCRRCVHEAAFWRGEEGAKGCPVMVLHGLWNYEATDDETKAIALNTLIPLDGIHNGQCTMFVEER